MQEKDREHISEFHTSNPDETLGIDRSIAKLEERRASKEPQRQAGELKGQRVRFFTEKLLARILSGVVYVCLIVGALWLGPFATCVLMMAMAWLCASEFLHMCRLAGRMPNEFLSLSASLAFPLMGYFAGSLTTLWVSFGLLLCTVVWYVITPRANLADVALTYFCPMYTSFTFVFIVLIRQALPQENGFWLCLAILGTFWANDTLAYLVGSRIGSRPMAPKISPHKTWEGFFGGMLGSIAVWIAVALLHIVELNVAYAIFIGFVVGIMGVVGDLFESRIKRGVGVKDSGTLMPGHGGLLDRSDSFLIGSMVAFALLRLGGIL